VSISRAGQKWTVVLASSTGMIITLDITIVNIALEDIARSLHAGLGGLQWIINAYSLAIAALLLGAGSLSDRIGRRRVFVIGAATFTVASAICGLAPDVTVLALARGLQGIGAALMFAPALALIAAAYEERRARQTAIGIFAAAGASAGALGPLIGGLIVEGLGWRWIFLVNVPLGALIVAAALAKLPESAAPGEAGGLDPRGVAFAAIALFALNYALIGEPTHGWLSPAVLAALLVSAAFMAAFVMAERGRDGAMLDLRLFRIPSFVGAAVLSLFIRMTSVGILAFLTLWLQGMLAYSPLQAGLRLLPFSVMLLVIGPLAGRLQERFPASAIISAGFALSAAGFLVMARVDAQSGWTVMLPGFVLVGIGGALSYPPLMSVAVSVVPPRKAGMASGATSSFFPLGTALALTVFGALFSNGVARVMNDAAVARTGLPATAVPGLRTLIEAGRFGTVRSLAAPLSGRVDDLARSAFTSALSRVCLAAAAVCALAVCTSIAMIRTGDMARASVDEVAVDEVSQ
jgi:EmrB/QacA subfamily drug resistance transporter